MQFKLNKRTILESIFGDLKQSYTGEDVIASIPFGCRFKMFKYTSVDSGELSYSLDVSPYLPANR